MYNLARHKKFTFWNVHNLKNSYLIPICGRVPAKRWTRLYSKTDRSELFENAWTSWRFHKFQFQFLFVFKIFFWRSRRSVQLFRILMFSVINKLQNLGRDLSLARLAFLNIFWQFSSNFVNNCAYWRWKLRVHLIKQLTDSSKFKSEIKIENFKIILAKLNLKLTLRNVLWQTLWVYLQVQFQRSSSTLNQTCLVKSPRGIIWQELDVSRESEENYDSFSVGLGYYLNSRSE